MTPLEFVRALTTGASLRSAWTSGDGLNVYIRRGQHYLNGEMGFCLDIVNVSAHHPGDGAFKKFLDQVEAEVQNSDCCDFVFVECILQPRLVPFLMSRGYQMTSNSMDLAPHMFKKFHHPMLTSSRP